MAEPLTPHAPGRPPEGDPHHVLVPSGVTDDRTRVLKHGDTFAVFDHLGQIKPGGLGEEGLYHDGTRYLSRLILELDGQPPFFLGSTVRDENDQLSVALTNPDRVRDRRVEVPLGTLHLALRTLLWQGACHWRLRARNHGPRPVEASICLRFRADFADIFEVRGMRREARGRDLPPDLAPGRVTLGYLGLDGQHRRTLLRFTPAPVELASDRARFALSLRPREEVAFDLVVACRRGEEGPEPPGFDDAQAAAAAALERLKAGSGRVAASESRFDAWLRRSQADLHMMTSDLPTGPYPYAGVPWFNTPFGRDGIISALQCLWLRPGLARGVLKYLAATQATEVIPSQDAEPGKILHETRNGEMAALGEMPFGRYYGSVDATPLFVLLAGAYYERTADRPFAESIWPNVEAALAWIDDFGDRDGDGFVEYERRAADGLIHQGWKDSDDAVSHADGAPAPGPIALC
jgi:glycogen debranching enzyme